VTADKDATERRRKTIDNKVASQQNTQAAGASSAGAKPRFERKSPTERRRQLIDAAIRCLGRGGISAFTIDNICQEADVSRGLINHHFESKQGLLLAVYETMTAYLEEITERCLASDAATAEERLRDIIDASVSPHAFSRSQFKAWLALWGEIANDERLQELHRRRYQIYRQGLAEVLRATAKARQRTLDADGLATASVALIDGLWVEWGLDPQGLSPEEAKAACYGLIEAQLGPISR
jgi:AcrR family transcriptional regulator